MSEGLNRVMLLGSVGAEPELKVTQGGQSVLRIRMATNERYQDKAGEWKDRTEWHSVVVWGKRAEGLHKILEKGSMVFIEGALRTTSYEDRDKNKRTKTEVVASKVLLCGKGGQRRQEARQEQASEPQAGKDHSTDDYPVSDDDLPF